MLADGFRRCAEQGWAHVPAVVRSLEELAAAVADVPLAPLDPQVGAVRQRGESGVAPVAGRPVLEALAVALAEASGGWQPDEVAVARYGGDGGITAHRDNAFYTGFVAVVTVAGRAPFRVLSAREGGEVLASFVAGPGDVVLLRAAPGERPYHEVGAAEGGERTVVVLRRNERGAGRGWS